jgi:hypothetical protein
VLPFRILGHVEDDRVSMQVGRRISTNGPGGIVLKGRRDPSFGGLGRVVAAHSGLCVALQVVERSNHSLSMCFTNAIIVSDERGQGYCFRCRTCQIPRRPMWNLLPFAGQVCLAVGNELEAGRRILTLG